MRLLFSRAMYITVRVVIALVFVYAGTVKLLDLDSFASLISRYGLVPPFLLDAVTIGLPVLEVIAGIALVFDSRFSLETITAMVCLFLFVLWFGILKDLHIDCGCFSAGELSEHGSLRAALYRDIVLLGMTSYLFLWRHRHKFATPPRRSS